MVVGLHKGQGRHHGFPELVSHFDLELGALLVEPVFDVAHGNVLAQRWRRNARSNNALEAGEYGDQS